MVSRQTPFSQAYFLLFSPWNRRQGFNPPQGKNPLLWVTIMESVNFKKGLEKKSVVKKGEKKVPDDPSGRTSLWRKGK